MKTLKHISFLIFILGLSMGNKCIAQNYADKEYYLVDSLELEAFSEADIQLIESSLTNYHASKDDTSRVNSLTAICEGVNHDDWSKFQFFQYNLIKNALRKKISKAEEKHLTASHAGALNNLGIIYEIKGNVKKAIECYDESLAIDKKRNDKRGIAYTLNNIGFVYDKQGDIPKALEYYHQSLKTMEELNDKNGISYTLNNIGLIHHYQGNTKKAKEFHTKSLKLRTELDDKNGMASSYNNLGLLKPAVPMTY